MDKVKVDFVITDLEMQIETPNNIYGSWVNFRFIDTAPNKPRLLNAIYELERHEDVEVIDYQYTETPITEKTNLKDLDITRN